MTGEYEVGKNKPPKKSQWKPGQSGNPRGSSKKARDHAKLKHELKQLKPFDAMLLEELREEVSGMIGGEHLTMMAGRAIIKALLRDALTGNARDRRETIKLLDKLGCFKAMAMRAEEEENWEDHLTPAERKMLEEVLALDCEDEEASEVHESDTTNLGTEELVGRSESTSAQT